MGLPEPALQLLIEAVGRQPRLGQVLTLGVLEVSVARDQVLQMVIRAGAQVHPTALQEFTRKTEEAIDLEAILLLLGATGVETLDKFPGEGASIVADLNQPVPPELVGLFSLIIDGGTLEHVFDVAQAFKNLIALAALGGRVLHVSPVAGWENHGFYSFSPKLFARLYGQNGFQVEQAALIHTPRVGSGGVLVEPCSADEPHLFDTLRQRSLVFFLATKEAGPSEFVCPVDTHQTVGDPAPLPETLDERPAPVWIDPRTVEHEEGHCYTAKLPSDVRDAVLLEDGVLLSAGDRSHDSIRRRGAGQHSFWVKAENVLYFSASDNSDPRTSGRRYAYQTVKATEALQSEALAWRDDEEFNTFYERAQRECGYGPADRHYVLKELLVSLGRLEANTAECGVFLGLGSSVICHYAQELPRADSVAHHCFDSFAGLSAPTIEDAPRVGIRPWEAGMMCARLPQVRANLARFDQVVFHAGWIPDCFATAEQDRFAFVHLDVDLYEPTRAAAEFFYPRLVPGGIMVCDDYGFLTCPGAKQALDELLSNRPERLIRLPTGQAYFVKSLEKPSG